jgi:hypothetical protein
MFARATGNKKTSMSNKKLLLLTSTLCFCGVTFSQTFMHGVGANIVVQSTPGYNAQTVPSVIYSPRFAFLEADGSSFSVGLPISLAFRGIYPTEEKRVDAIGWMLNAPLMLDFNDGAGSGKSNNSRVGFFFGGGFGYHANVITKKDYTGNDIAYPMSGFGPAGEAGIRFSVGKHRRNVEFRISYMKTQDTSGSGVFGIGCVFGN